jgi:hypothetical protein
VDARHQADVEGEAGDVDPVQPVEDALRTFPADEILTVGSAAENGGLEASGASKVAVGVGG